MDKSRIQKALDSLVYLPHLKEKALHSAINPAENEGGGKGRVWDRGDLFRRLQSFKPSTWFCKPASISPVECARRGWVNSGPDLLTCEHPILDVLQFCKHKVSCPIPPELLPEEASQLAERFAQQLSDSHDSPCPWRSNCCAASLLQFPPLTQEATEADFHRRIAALQRLVCLPPLSLDSYHTIAATHPNSIRQMLQHGPGGAPGAAQRHLVRDDLPGALGSSPSASQAQQAQQQGLGGCVDGDDGGGMGTPEQGQRVAGEEGGAAMEAADQALLSTLSEGVLTWNSQGFEARLRLLALCGWDLRVVTVGGDVEAQTGRERAADSSSAGGGAARAEGGDGAGGSGDHVRPECSALLCPLCGAKAGLWTFFPGCKPQVLAGPARRASGQGEAGLSASGRLTGGGSTGTTIAGGAFSAAGGGCGSGEGGPFGRRSFSAGMSLFGVPIGSPAGGGRDAAGTQHPRTPSTIAGGMWGPEPGRGGTGAAGEEGAAPATEVSSGAQGTPGSCQGGNPSGPKFGGGGQSPVFGLAALRQGGTPSGVAEDVGGEGGGGAEAAAGGVKRKGAPGSSLEGEGGSGPGSEGDGKGGGGEGLEGPEGGVPMSLHSPHQQQAKRSRCSDASDPSTQPAYGPLQYCGTEALQRYRSMAATPLDPLSLHRRFCPWVNQQPLAQQQEPGVDAGEAREGTREAQPARCGWKWCLQQLIPDDVSFLLAAASGGSGSDGRQGWDPAKLLRSVLRRVEVHN